LPVRKIRIALIEDSPTVRFFYKGLFEKAGFEVFEAENSQAGWDIICNHHPDVIVLDMMMPGIPGIELLKRIRSVEFSKNIPVLVLSSIKEPDQIQQIVEQGADHYSLKGMDSPELIKDLVYRLMKEKQTQRVAGSIDAQHPLEEKKTVEEIDRLFWWF